MRAGLLAIALCSSVGSARTASVPDPRPATVTITRGEGGALYADPRGRTLYALNMRIANSRSGASLTYCVGPCQERWSPLAAPADAAPVGDWKVLVGAQGPQWAYRNNLVFTYKPDVKAGAAAGDGYDDLWTAIRYVPPAPALVAPAIVAAHYVDGRYVLSDTGGRRLFTPRGACGPTCAAWSPLVAGMAARDVGAWTVLRNGLQPQWAYRGKPVYVAPAEEPDRMPADGLPLQL